MRLYESIFGLLVVSLCAETAGCNCGANSSIHHFRAELREGLSVSQVVADGASAQRAGLRYEVETRGCQPRNLSIEHQAGLMSIRVSEPAKGAEASVYHETGYATPEDFWAAVTRVLPEFYSCGHFRITFLRDGCYPNQDFLTVGVDQEGRITEISDVYWAE